MVFCNNNICSIRMPKGQSHNPYFNRWFSAIYKIEQMTEEHYGHNPYFNRWFSAIVCWMCDCG